MKHTTYSSKLTNGSMLHLIDVPDSSVVEARIYFDAGFERFGKDKYQIPHLLEHLLLGSSRKYPDEETLMRAVQELGANVNASTDFQHITVWLKAPRKNFIDALNIVFDSVFEAKITQESLDREREIVLREIHERFDSISDRSVNLMMGTAFDEIVSEEWESYLSDTANYSLEDIQHAYEIFIKANSMRVQIAGKLDGSLRKKLQTYFHELPVNTSQTPSILNANPEGASIVPATIDLEGNAGITLAFVSPIKENETNRERSSLNFANQLLFGAPSAVIPLKLRQKGVVYSINADTITLTNWHVFIVQVMCDQDKAPIAIAEIFRYLHLYSNGHIAQDEIESVKKYIDGMLSISTETVGDLIEWYSGDTLRDRTLTSVEQELKIVKNLESVDVAEGIKKLFTEAKIYGIVASDDAYLWADKFSTLSELISKDKSKENINTVITTTVQNAQKLRGESKEGFLGFRWAFYWALSIVVWVTAVRVSQLPLKGSDETISALTYAANYNTAWGLGFFIPFTLGALLTWVRGKYERWAEYTSITLFFITGLVYAYGIFAYFGDVGIDKQPWYEHATSIAQPLFFFVAAPLAFIGVVKRLVAKRQA